METTKFESFKAWGIANPNRLYIASWFGSYIITGMIFFLFALLMPIDTNLDDPVFEPIFAIMVLVPMILIDLPVSIAVLKIKHRSMWWMLLFLWYSPLWLSDSKKQCNANYIYVLLVLDAIFLTYGLTYTLEYAQKNPLDTIWNGIIIYAISLILASIANSGFDKDDIIALEDLSIHDAKDPEANE